MPKPRCPNETPCLAHLHRNSGPANSGGAGTGKGWNTLLKEKENGTRNKDGAAELGASKE